MMMEGPAQAGAQVRQLSVITRALYGVTRIKA